jgi:hypothetical protein
MHTTNERSLNRHRRWVFCTDRAVHTLRRLDVLQYWPEIQSLSLLPAHAGEVAVGRRADLVLLQDNPLANLETLRKPLGVLAHGRWYDAATLATLLHDRQEHYERVLCQP